MSAAAILLSGDEASYLREAIKEGLIFAEIQLAAHKAVCTIPNCTFDAVQQRECDLTKSILRKLELCK